MKLKTIVNIYDALNSDLFADVLERPIILIKRWRWSAGEFKYATNSPDVMAFNPMHFRDIDARTTIFHEMIHQYVYQYLDIQEDNDHGDEFKRNYRLFADDLIEHWETHFAMYNSEL